MRYCTCNAAVQQSRTLIFGAPRVDCASSSSDLQRAAKAALLAD